MIKITKQTDIKECLSGEFFDFYTNSRRLRNRLAHRYKMPKDEELCESLGNNLFYINELEESLGKYILNDIVITSVNCRNINYSV